MSRPGFEGIFMRLAFDVARRSTCRRLQVGCVICTLDYRRVIAFGYNGNAHGLPNECDSHEPGNCGDIHAEANAIVKCYEPPDVQKVVLVTDLPCKACAKLLVQLGGVRLVLYAREYRLRDGLDVLAAAGIPAHPYVDDEAAAR